MILGKPTDLADFDFSKSGVVLIDQQLNVRRLMWSALKQIGFEDVRDCNTLEEALEFLAVSTPDLLIVDLDIDHKEVCARISDIRNQVIGHNPFVVIIATTWNPSEDAIRRVLNAGADDIVNKPISMQLLLNRVSNLIRNRKDFIVTTSYVGPDRRSRDRVRAEESEGVAIETMPVPNSLRHKATGDARAAVDPETIRQAAEALTSQKLRHLTNGIVELADSLERATQARRGGRRSKRAFDELTGLVCQVTEFVEDRDLRIVSQLSRSMRDVMSTILDSADPEPQKFEILRLHSQAIAASLDARDTDFELTALELNKAVEKAAAGQAR
jgi:DNA-binding response OmpR family regulator